MIAKVLQAMALAVGVAVLFSLLGWLELRREPMRRSGLFLAFCALTVGACTVATGFCIGVLLYIGMG